MQRIVVEQHEMTRLRTLRERHGIGRARVPPADAMLVLGNRVLPIVDEHVGLSRDRQT
jgi:hypothetical protein